MKKIIPMSLSLFIIAGCNDKDTLPLTETNAIKLMEKNIGDKCIYQTINPTFNVSLNTVRPFEDFLSGKIVDDKDRNIISVKEDDKRLLDQALALEDVGFVNKIANHIIKDSSSDIYYDNSSLVGINNKGSITLNKLKGYQFKLTPLGESMIRKWYDSEGTIDVCISHMKVDKIKITILNDGRTHALAEMTHDDLLDWAKNEKVLNAFGDFTDTLYEDALIGLKEAYFVPGGNGYVVENNKINTIR